MPHSGCTISPPAAHVRGRTLGSCVEMHPETQGFGDKPPGFSVKKNPLRTDDVDIKLAVSHRLRSNIPPCFFFLKAFARPSLPAANLSRVRACGNSLRPIVHLWFSKLFCFFTRTICFLGVPQVALAMAKRGRGNKVVE